jgi:hypothetical protein
MERLNRLQARSLIVGVIALVLSFIGAFFSAKQFFVSYLFAYLFWLGLAVGCIVITMMHHLTGGRWGHLTRRFSEAGFSTLPLMALLSIPILFGLHDLYPWARPEKLTALLMKKRGYLNKGFYIGRFIFYFAVWLWFAWRLRKWSLAQDKTDSKLPTARLAKLSGLGLVVLPLTATFAYFDWIMSMEAEWYSTIFAVIVLAGQVLMGYAFAVVLLRQFEGQEPFSTMICKTHFHQLGNLLLTFVLFWTYVAFGQLLIIYSANLPDEISWYLHRIAGGWKYVLGIIALFHFFLPFLVLLFRAAKRHGRSLAALAFVLLVVHLLDSYWMIAPSAFNHGLQVSWLNFATPIGIGGVWLAAFFWILKRAPLVPVNDPRMREEIAHAEE